ncbi:MAG: hypothetical protein ABWJ42_04950 [Sulfolobales archaeon]
MRSRKKNPGRDFRVENLYIDKVEVLERILEAGLLEDFLEWARKRGARIDEVKLDEIDHRYVLEYAIERRLIDLKSELDLRNISREES